MADRKVKVLLIEDDEDFSKLVELSLLESKYIYFCLNTCSTLDKGINELKNNKYDVIILDLNLPDSKGINTFDTLYDKFPEIPIIVLTGDDNDKIAVSSVSKGAQDYLVKEDITSKYLIKSILYSIERNNLLERIRQLSLIDWLTKLYNRKGFLLLGEQQLNISKRTKKNYCFLFIDIDDMKIINDTMGHLQGDFALEKFAGILRKTFRKTDIIARLGGDEFVVLAMVETKEDSSLMINRLSKNIDEFNKNNNFNISISVGKAYFDYTNPSSIYELLEKSDKSMYKEKSQKKKSR